MQLVDYKKPHTRAALGSGGELMLELIVIDISETKPKSLYARQFKTHPRVGEWIEIDENDEGVLYEVVKVAHSTNGGD